MSETAWKKEVVGILRSLWDNPCTGVDFDGQTILNNHLCRMGNWVDGHSQARSIPPEALKESARAAERAILKLQSTAPQVTYSRIFQDADESFVSFTEHLRKAVDL